MGRRVLRSTDRLVNRLTCLLAQHLCAGLDFLFPAGQIALDLRGQASGVVCSGSAGVLIETTNMRELTLKFLLR